MVTNITSCTARMHQREYRAEVGSSSTFRHSGAYLRDLPRNLITDGNARTVSEASHWDIRLSMASVSSAGDGPHLELQSGRKTALLQQSGTRAVWTGDIKKLAVVIIDTSASFYYPIWTSIGVSLFRRIYFCTCSWCRRTIKAHLLVSRMPANAQTDNSLAGGLMRLGLLRSRNPS